MNLTLLALPIIPNEDGSLLAQVVFIEEIEEGVGGPSYGHGIRLEPQADAAKAVADIVAMENAHFARGIDTRDGVKTFAPLSKAAVRRLEGAAKAAWTPEIVARWDAAREQRRLEGEANEALQAAEREDLAKAQKTARANLKEQMRGVLAELLSEQPGKSKN